MNDNDIIPSYIISWLWLLGSVGRRILIPNPWISLFSLAATSLINVWQRSATRPRPPGRAYIYMSEVTSSHPRRIGDLISCSCGQRRNITRVQVQKPEVIKNRLIFLAGPIVVLHIVCRLNYSTPLYSSSSCSTYVQKLHINCKPSSSS